MAKHSDHDHHDHDYAHDHHDGHDHDYGYYHHHHYYGGYPVIVGGDVVSGDYVPAGDTYVVDTAGTTPETGTPVATSQVYTVYFKDKSGNAQTYGRFDSSAEGDRLAETQDRLTAAGVAWWTVDPNGVQVDTDIDN
jgi:hypothetical protein